VCAEDPASEISREAWAALFLATVRQELLRGAEPAVERAAVKSDVTLTATSDQLDASEARGSQTLIGAGAEAARADSKPDDERVEFEFDGGRLGMLALGIVRRNGAVEVVVGVEDPRQLALMDLERGALVASLKAAGLNVASVSVMSREQAGTALAQRRRGINAEPREMATAAYRSRRVRQETDADEGLNLVG